MTEDEVREIAEAALYESAACVEEDPVYAELMATYAQLGNMLGSGRSDRDYEQECRELVDRILELGVAASNEATEQWDIWLARNEISTEGHEQSELPLPRDDETAYRPIWPLAWVERCTHNGCDATFTFYIPPTGDYRCVQRQILEEAAHGA